MPTTNTIDATTPAGELERRAANKLRKTDKRRKFHAAQDAALAALSGAELRSLAGLPTRTTRKVVEAPVVEAPKAPKVTTRTAHTVSSVKELTDFQKAVLADPATYGEGFGAKRKARGLASLTTEQRAARKALYASLNG
jgi:hypothetical protein